MLPHTIPVHCYAGIAGDMALGSLLDAGADFDEVLAMLTRLPVGGWDLEPVPVLRGGLAATHAVVRTDDDAVVRTYSHIVGLVEEGRLPARVRDRVLGAADVQPGEMVLDVGAGTGLLTFGARKLVGETGQVVAVDISVDALYQLLGAAQMPFWTAFVS